MDTVPIEWLMAPGAPELPDLLNRPSWHQQAACRGSTSTFFSNIEVARATCRKCPVRQECYDVAMADPSLEGIWAGLDAKERRALRRSVA